MGWVGGLWFGLIALLLIVLCTVSFGGLRLYLWFLFSRCSCFGVGCIVVAWLCFGLCFGFAGVLVVAVFAGVVCDGAFVDWQLMICYAGLGLGLLFYLLFWSGDVLRVLVFGGLLFGVRFVVVFSIVYVG